MNHSNRGLNEPFYKWIDDVRRAMRKEKELQEKLEFYNMKLIGYKGVSYDRIGSSGSRSSGDSELLFWLDKIDIIEKHVFNNNKIISSYYSFISKITCDEILLLKQLTIDKKANIKNEVNLYSKSEKFKRINIMIRKWMNYMAT
ncbi:MAG: hypothetical protein AB1414_02355 [bacterium]